jgi:hypothetical protein
VCRPGRARPGRHAAAILLLVAANVLFAYHVPALGAGVLAGAAVHLLVGYRVAATTFLADPGPRASNSGQPAAISPPSKSGQQWPDFCVFGRCGFR